MAPLGPEMSAGAPFTEMLPPLVPSRPYRARSTFILPEPSRPKRPRISPLRSEKLILSMMPSIVRSFTSMIVAPMGRSRLG